MVYRPRSGTGTSRETVAYLLQDSPTLAAMAGWRMGEVAKVEQQSPGWKSGKLCQPFWLLLSIPHCPALAEGMRPTEPDSPVGTRYDELRGP